MSAEPPVKLHSPIADAPASNPVSNPFDAPPVRPDPATVEPPPQADTAPDSLAADLDNRLSRRRLVRLNDRVAVETIRDAIREMDRLQGVTR